MRCLIQYKCMVKEVNMFKFISDNIVERILEILLWIGLIEGFTIDYANERWTFY